MELKEQGVVNDKANLDFLIATGKRHKLVAITIEGNHYFTTDTIRARMFLQTANFLQFPHGRYSENLLRRDHADDPQSLPVQRIPRREGHARAQDDYRGKAGDIAVTMRIEEGPQYVVNSVQVEGMEKMDRERVLAQLSSTEGQPFSEFNVAVDRDTILAGYFESGFPKATFEWSSKPAADRPTAWTSFSRSRKASSSSCARC